MAINRISSFAVHNNTLNDVGRVQTNLFNLQAQISSGQKTRQFEGIDRQVEQFVILEAKVKKSTSYMENNSLALSRLNTTLRTMEDVVTTFDDIENLLTSQRSPNGASIDYKQNLQSLRENLNKLLNTSYEGRFLFGGTKTNVPPVIDDPFVEPSDPSVIDDSYYQGSKEDLTLRIQDNFEIKYNIRADDEAFQQVYSAIALMLKGDNLKNDAMVQRALSQVQTGIQGAIALQTRVQSDIVVVEDANERHEALNLYFKGVKEGIINTDLVEASTLVASNEAVLQATFQSFSSINQLRLADFLR